MPTCMYFVGFPSGSVVKNPPANARDMGWIRVRKIPWRRKWQPTTVFLPRKSHGQRSFGELQFIGLRGSYGS